MKQAEQPGQHRWTRHDYERLIEHGFLDEDDPIELLDGLLLVKEPQHSLHRTAVLLAAKALERAFGEGWFVQVQSPIALDGRVAPARPGRTWSRRLAMNFEHAIDEVDDPVVRDPRAGIGGGLPAAGEAQA